MNSEYIAPEFNKEAFNCPYCNAFAHQYWINIYRHNGDFNEYAFFADQPNSFHYYQFSISTCSRCRSIAHWVDDKMVYPSGSFIELPNPDMPEEVKIDYLEARDIFRQSPRGAGALLRLSLEKLLIDLDNETEKSESINDAIKKLVDKGLGVQTQQAMDSIRVFGNEAVHPSDINIDEYKDLAPFLFWLLNEIVSDMITKPKKMAEIYSKIPKGKRKGIEDRDKNKG